MKSLLLHAVASLSGLQALSIPLPSPASPVAPVEGTTIPPDICICPDSGSPEAGGSRNEASRADEVGPTSMFAKDVIESTGAIEADVDAFRALLGNPNNGAIPAPQLAGRREINWDAVPAAVTNIVTFPNDFFLVNSPRGLLYKRVTRGLEVSDNRFVNLNPTYAAEFNPFSGQKLFSPVGNNVSELRFFLPGGGPEATVRGFGAVFLDVDIAGVSSIEVFGEDGQSLGSFAAPVRSDARGASFVGVVYRNPLISRVRIVTGDGRLSANEIDVSQGGRHDLVVLDDFLYGEPTPTGN